MKSVTIPDKTHLALKRAALAKNLPLGQFVTAILDKATAPTPKKKKS